MSCVIKTKNIENRTNVVGADPQNTMKAPRPIVGLAKERNDFGSDLVPWIQVTGITISGCSSKSAEKMGFIRLIRRMNFVIN